MESKQLTPEEIVKKLSDWSRKYPRGMVYSFSQKKMDDELVEIEEAAKSFIDHSLTSKESK